MDTGDLEKYIFFNKLFPHKHILILSPYFYCFNIFPLSILFFLSN